MVVDFELLGVSVLSEAAHDSYGLCAGGAEELSEDI